MALTLTAEQRTAEEKTDGLRVEKLVPSVLYGFETENQTLKVKQQEFKKVFSDAGSSQIVDLSVDGKVHHVLIKEVQIDPVRRDPVHIDFYSVDVSKPVQVNIPLHFIGEAPAVKASGGSLMRKLNTIEVECLPVDLVKFFEVPLGVLETLEDIITVKDVVVSDKFTVLSDANALVATVVPPRVEASPEVPVEGEDGAAEGEDGEAKPAEGDAAPAAEEKKE